MDGLDGKKSPFPPHLFLYCVASHDTYMNNTGKRGDTELVRNYTGTEGISLKTNEQRHFQDFVTYKSSTLMCTYIKQLIRSVFRPSLILFFPFFFHSFSFTLCGNPSK